MPIEALEQLLAAVLDEDILVPADIGGATHEFTASCRPAAIRFSVGYELTEAVRAAVLALPEAARQAAIDAFEEERLGAWVAELTDAVELSGGPRRRARWSAASALIPAPSSASRMRTGHRFTCFLTDQEEAKVAALELRHRRRARVEDRIRCAKGTELGKLPFHVADNEVWLELVLIAQDLFAWAEALCLEGELRLAERKRLRHRLLHTAARLVRSGRRTRLRLAPRLALVRGVGRGVSSPAGAPARRRALTLRSARR